MNALMRICLLAVLGIFTFSAPATIPGDRVNEVCVEAGDIAYCAPEA